MPSQSDLIYIGICYKRTISIAHHCNASFISVFTRSDICIQNSRINSVFNVCLLTYLVKLATYQLWENIYSVQTEVFKSLLLNYGHLKQTDTFNHAAPALPKKESNTRPSFKSYFQSYIGQGSEGLRGIKNKFYVFLK